MNTAIFKLAPSAPQLVFKNIPLGTTEAEIADWLWSTLGLNIPAEHVSCNDAGVTSGLAFVHISREVMAEFFTRYLCDQSFNVTRSQSKRRSLAVSATHHSAGALWQRANRVTGRLSDRKP
jgi:hypothetical protein